MRDLGGATVRTNIFNTVFALAVALLSLFGLISGQDLFGAVLFCLLLLICLVFVFAALRIKIYCGETEFVYCGALGRRVTAAYESIDSLVIHPLSVSIMLCDGERIRIPTPCVSGIRMFVNIARISDIRYSDKK